MNVPKLIFNDLLKSFEKNNFLYAVLRNYEEEYFRQAKDIDLLISASEKEEIITLIYSVISKYSLLTYVQEDQKRIVITFLHEEKHSEEKQVFKIDLNKYLTLKNNQTSRFLPGWGRRVYIEELETKIYKEDYLPFGIHVLEKSQEVLFLLNHYRHKRKKSYEEKINNYFSNIEEEIRIESISDKRIVGLFKSLEEEYLPKFSFTKNFIAWVKSCFQYVYYKIKSIRNAKVIYFSGPDGAGKSTTYLWTMKWFDQLGVKYYPLRSMQILLQNVLFLRNKLKGRSSSSDTVFSNVGKLGYSDLERDRNDGTFKWKLRRLIGLLVGLIDIVIFGRIYIFLKRCQGNIVLVEESPVDIFVKRHRPRVIILEGVFLSLIPKPTLSLLCTSEAKIIYERKPELELIEIEDYYKRIIPLLKKSNFNYSKVPTDIQMNNTKNKLINSIKNIM